MKCETDDMTKHDNPTRPSKAYRNDDFLNSLEGRPLRILAEYAEPKSRFERHQIQDTIVFFGSARLVSREVAEAGLAAARVNGGDVARAERRLAMSRYYEDTRVLAARLTAWSKALPPACGCPRSSATSPAASRRARRRRPPPGRRRARLRPPRARRAGPSRRTRWCPGSGGARSAIWARRIRRGYAAGALRGC